MATNSIDDVIRANLVQAKLPGNALEAMWSNIQSMVDTPALEPIGESRQGNLRVRNRRGRSFIYPMVAGLAFACILAGGIAVYQGKRPAPVEGVRSVAPARGNLDSGHWRVVGHDTYILEGQIAGVVQGGSHPFVKLRIGQVMLSGPLHTPAQPFPYDSGATVTIPFEDSLAAEGPMMPRLNEKVEIVVNQFVDGNNGKPFWGSDERGFFYQKSDGQFYGKDGYVLGIAT